MALFFTTKTLFLKIIPWWHLFTLFVLSRASEQHYFSKYWGNGYMGRPHLTFFRGQSP